MLNKKRKTRISPCLPLSCLSVNLYVPKSLLSVAWYPKVLQRYEIILKPQWIGCKNLRKVYVKHPGASLRPSVKIKRDYFIFMNNQAII